MRRGWSWSAWRNSRSAPGQLSFRACIILECAGGASNAAEAAAKLRTTGFTVGLWRDRFIAEGVVGLRDEPRPGAPREIGDEKVEQVVRLTLEKTPKGATHWSSPMLAVRTGLSQSTISHIWRVFGLKPHRTWSFQLSTDPLLIDKVRDILGLYLDSPHHALVLCVDEKSQIQALSRTQPMLPTAPTKQHWFVIGAESAALSSALHSNACFRLNQVERWFALLTQRQIKRGSHRSVQELEAAIGDFIAAYNKQPEPFRWTKSADQILTSIARFATTTLHAHSVPVSTRNQ